MFDIINPVFYLSNRNGIPRLESTGVNVTSTAVEFSFNSNATFANRYNGLVLFKISQAPASGTTTTLPVVFTSRYGTLVVTTVGGTAMTIADMPTGIYLGYYESNTGTLLIIN